MSDILFATVATITGDAPHHVMAGLWLATHGWDITLVCPFPTQTQRVATELGEVNLDPIPITGRLKTHLNLFRKIVRHRFRGTKLFYVQGNPSCVAAYFALIGVPSSRIVYHTQDLMDPRKFRRMEFFERAIARKAGAVISNERARARFLASYYDLRQVPTVVRTALPSTWPEVATDPATRKNLLDRFPKAASGSGPEDIRLITAGSHYSAVRCSRQLIQALAQLPSSYRLVFTSMTPGNRPWQQAESLARSLGVENRICFLPRMEYRELLEHFAACDIGMLLYPNDSFGNYFQQPGRLTEYMHAGIPMVTSNFMGLEELVSRYQLGSIADPESPESIAQAIAKIGDRPTATREADRLRLRELARTELAYETQFPRIETILKTMMKGNP